MESGVLYLSISIAHFLASFGNSSFAIYMLGEMVRVGSLFTKKLFETKKLTFLNLSHLNQNASVIGIAFNLVLIRTAQNKMEDEDAKDEETTEINFNWQFMTHIEAGSSSVGTQSTVNGNPG